MNKIRVKKLVIRLLVLPICFFSAIGCLHYDENQDEDGGPVSTDGISSGSLWLQGYPVQTDGRDRPEKEAYCETLVACVCTFSSNWEQCAQMYRAMSDGECAERLQNDYSYCQDEPGAGGDSDSDADGDSDGDSDADGDGDWWDDTDEDW